MKRWLREREEFEKEERFAQRELPEFDGEALPFLRSAAVAVFVETPVGIPLVRDRRRGLDSYGNPRPVYWKLPGGRVHVDEYPEDAAVREAGEETGAELDAKLLRQLSFEDRGNHDYIIFKTTSRTRQFKERGDEDEEVGIFSPEEIIEMQDFFPAHRSVVEPVLKELCSQAVA